MKKIVTILAVAAALVATSCTGNTETEGTTVDTTAVEAVDTAEVIEETVVVEEDTTEATSVYAEGSVEQSILDFLASEETGTKSFILDALSNVEGEEGSELSEEANLQLSNIADILAANPDLKAEIQAHGPDKIGMKPKTTIQANWVKGKLVLFKDFKGEQLRAVGHGSDHLIEGVDSKDDAQKRIVIELTK